MQLLIKQRVFSWTDTYDIYDEWNNPKYFVKAEFFSLTHQLHVYDNNEREIGIIHQKMFTLLPTFEIEVDGEIRGVIKIFLFPSPVRNRLPGMACGRGFPRLGL